MTRYAHSLFCIFLLLLVSGPFLVAYGQDTRAMSDDPTASFERISGLSHNTILALLQDREGFIWIGTSDGLSRFDGYEFITYLHVPRDTTSLFSNTVTALLEGRDGTLWVGMENGLDAFDRTTEQFAHFTFSSDTLSQHVHALFEDATGGLWIGTDDGFVHLDPETGHSSYYAAAAPGALTGFYNMDRQGEEPFWLGTLQGSEAPGVYRFEPQGGRFSYFPLPEGWQAQAGSGVLLGRGDTLWVGTPHATGAFDTRTERFTRLPDLRGEPWLEDRRGGLWVDDGTALWRYDAATHTRTAYRLDASGTNWLARDVRAMLEDQTGTLWAGTLGGLFRLDPYRKPFVHRQHAPDNRNTLSSNVVMSVYEDHGGALWVGTLGGGLNRLDPHTGAVSHYRGGDLAGLCHDNVWAVHAHRDGGLWLGTEAGLCLLDRQTGQFTQVVLGDAPSYVYVLAEDAAGTLWVGGEFLDRFDPATGTQHRYTATYFSERLQNFQAIYPAPSGDVWLGTEFSGLWRLDPATGAFESLPRARPGMEDVQTSAIRIIHPGSDAHTLWLGTDLGLIRYHIPTDTFHRYLQPDGLPGSSVFGILKDPTGNLWVSTNQGLARFDPRTEMFTTYSVDEGTGNTEYNRRAAFAGPTGAFHFGGLNGLTSFHPEAVIGNPHPPPVVLTHVETEGRDGQTVHPATQVARDGLVLRPQDNAFSFEFAALSFTNPSKNRYAYRLEGIDEQWIEAGTRRFARYSGLPPGRYVFRVRGANADGVWNEAGIAVPVRKLPAYWQTWWFRLAVMALMIGFVYSAYRYRLAQLLHEERLRLRIASDLHDEIGSKLSSIALASEMVTARAPLGDRERRQLTEVTKQARTMVDDLRDIVWMVNPRHDRLDDLVARMRHLAATLLDDMPHTFDASPGGLSTALGMERRRHLYLMYREVLTNIHRHARATQVDIQLMRQNGRLEVIVQDNGVGFDPAMRTHGDGLHNLHMRAEALDGTVRIESQPGAGTTIQITAKIPGNRDGFRPGSV